jgi:hypothetical protein
VGQGRPIRRLSAAALFILLVSGAGCSSKPSPEQSRAAAPEAKAWFQPAPQQGQGLHLAYKHDIGLDVTPSALQAHFASARDRCANEATLHCILLEASVEVPRPDAVRAPYAVPSAKLRVRLPHDQVARFANSLTDKLPGEADGTVTVARQSTTAEDLSRPIEDGDKRLSQLTDYRTRLNALAARPDTKVDDLVKIAGEISRVQADLEAAQAEQRELNQRVETEALDIDFESQSDHSAWAPARIAWSDAAQIFGGSLGDALQFVIAAVPWLPLFAVALVALRLVLRFLFGVPRRTRKEDPV